MNKYICLRHKLITSRKGLRKHLGKFHAKNKYTKDSNWKVEEWK